MDEEENEEGAYVDEAGDEDLDEEVSEGKAAGRHVIVEFEQRWKSGPGMPSIRAGVELLVSDSLSTARASGLSNRSVQ